MARLASTSSSGSVAVTEPSLPVSAPAAAPSPVAPSVLTDLRSGKEIAEAFGSSRINNALFRARHIEKDLP